MASKRYQIGLNWKLNPETVSQLHDLLEEYGQLGNLWESQNCTFFPPVLYLLSSEFLRSELGISIQTGSQDLFIEPQGGFTGQISPTQLQDITITQVMLGHSETRQINTLSNEAMKGKLAVALEYDLQPWLCLGYQVNPSIADTDVLQLDQIIDFITKVVLPSKDKILTKAYKIWLCYEPVWAIGSGQAATREQIERVFETITETLLQDFNSEEIKNHFGLIYGGSVSSKNILQLTQVKDLEGFLIGGASLKVEEVRAILENLKNN